MTEGEVRDVGYECKCNVILFNICINGKSHKRQFNSHLIDFYISIIHALFNFQNTYLSEVTNLSSNKLWVYLFARKRINDIFGVFI